MKMYEVVFYNGADEVGTWDIYDINAGEAVIQALAFMRDEFTAIYVEDSSLTATEQSTGMSYAEALAVHGKSAENK